MVSLVSARNSAVIGEDAKSVGRYFYQLDQAYKNNGYDYLPDKSIRSSARWCSF
ncbi:TcdA/TcdB pore-forming domain-containing protein [Providencia hangzhouensis]|uniref:TcdA/TcdB pore-forming domain-containing protein n=1 Tax=Providencia hangzhouensis TaxID=3031799 RepID=UPI0034DD193B